MGESTSRNDNRNRWTDPVPKRRVERMSMADRRALESQDFALEMLDLTEDLDSFSQAIGELRRVWHRQPLGARFDPEPLIRISGRVIGQHLVDSCHLGWAMARERGMRLPAIITPGLRIVVLPITVARRYWLEDSPTSVAQIAREIALISHAL